MSKRFILVAGGARTNKSRFAQTLAGHKTCGPVPTSGCEETKTGTPWGACFLALGQSLN